MSGKVLVVENLNIHFGNRQVVRNVSFTLEAGQTVALVGESGSGKSVIARSLIGLAGGNSRVTANTLLYRGQNLLTLNERKWQSLRGREIGFILQDALVSLDPLRPVGKEILEVLEIHDWGTKTSRKARVIELLERVGVPEPTVRALQRPDQLSGGLRQRALIASALALEPGLIIADEPTTALDATVQAQILALLKKLTNEGNSLFLISHDLAAVAQLADKVLVIQNGIVVEHGPTHQVLQHPQHAYTKSLLDAAPAEHPRGTRLSSSRQVEVRPSRPEANATVILEARNLAKNYVGPDHVSRPAVQDVSFDLRAGRTLGIVGESGSGKSTVARIVLGLLEPDGGSVALKGLPWVSAPPNSIAERDRRPHRQQISIIYQDPLSSFDPRWNVGQILSDALDVGGVAKSEIAREVSQLLNKVRLAPDVATRRPLELSGGQRQRVAIARAIASRPLIIVCDEPVSALDVSVQAQVLDLLADLQEELGLAYLFISHDLGVIRHVSDEVLVLHHGEAVEYTNAEDLFASPKHQYTRSLLNSVPRLPSAHNRVPATELLCDE